MREVASIALWALLLATVAFGDRVRLKERAVIHGTVEKVHPQVEIVNEVGIRLLIPKELVQTIDYERLPVSPLPTAPTIPQIERSAIRKAAKSPFLSGYELQVT